MLELHTIFMSYNPSPTTHSLLETANNKETEAGLPFADL